MGRTLEEVLNSLPPERRKKIEERALELIEEEEREERDRSEIVLNDGMWAEVIHTAHLSEYFFNGHLRDHILCLELEKLHPELEKMAEEASWALRQVYSKLAELDDARKPVPEEPAS